MMAERYKQLLKTGSQYQAECPVLLSASALLLDTQTQHVFAQLKLQSITRKPITAVCVALVCFDPAGTMILCHEEYWLRDFEVKYSDQFGQKTAIPISKDAVRSFNVQIKTIVFSNGDTWEVADSSQVMQSLPSKESLDVLLGIELAEQYIRECKKISNREITNAPKKHEDLVFCACGAIYTSAESPCPHCGIDFEKYAFLANEATLKKQLNAYLEEEKQMIAKKSITAQRTKAEKYAKVAIILSSIIAIYSIIYSITTTFEISSIISQVFLVAIVISLLTRKKEIVAIVFGLMIGCQVFFLILSFNVSLLGNMLAGVTLFAILILAIKGYTIVKKIWFICGSVYFVSGFIDLILQDVLSYGVASFILNFLILLVYTARITYTALWVKEDLGLQAEVQ